MIYPNNRGVNPIIIYRIRLERGGRWPNRDLNVSTRAAGFTDVTWVEVLEGREQERVEDRMDIVMELSGNGMCFATLGLGSLAG